MERKVEYFMEVSNIDNNATWRELMDSESFGAPGSKEEAIIIANETIDYFNSTLRSGEEKRQLVGIEKVTTTVEKLDLESN